MHMHLCTAESFMTDAIVFHSKCSICHTHTVLRSGWTDTHCPVCDSYWNHEAWAGYIARIQRNLLGLTRKEIALEYGVGTKTIRNYETSRISKKYSEYIHNRIKKSNPLIGARSHG